MTSLIKKAILAVVKVATKVIEERRRRIATLLQTSGFADLRTVCDRFNISPATARRDLNALVGERKIKRTYGGALSEDNALGEYNSRFTSFSKRRLQRQEAKTALAQKAFAFIQPGGIYFFDAGSSVYALAEILAAGLSDEDVMVNGKSEIIPGKRAEAGGQGKGLTVVTNSLPIVQKLGGLRSVDLYMLGGRVLNRQAALFDGESVERLGKWNFNAAFLGAEGMTPEGIWNSEAAIIKLQRRAMKQAERSYLLIDESKWGKSTEHKLVNWTEVDVLISDMTSRALAQRGVQLAPDHVATAK